MKLSAPEYYKNFKCIADRCQNSCCVGWEIDIDPESLEKYEGYTEGYGLAVRESIDHEGTPHFRLEKNDRCPHLDDSGLCRMIINLGEESLCAICREHPRFYNETPLGLEVGLGLSCEAAAQLILSSDDYDEIIDMGETECHCAFEQEGGFDPVSERGKIFEILKRREVPYVERLSAISRLYGVSPEDNGDESWRELFSSLEYLCEDDKVLFEKYTSDTETPPEEEVALERAFAYFIYRHATVTEGREEFRVAVGLAFLLERLLCSLIKAYPERDICDLARILSEEIEYSEDNTEEIKFFFV